MAKIRREEVIAEALNLLNEVGLDQVTTRRLAKRLGVESATLYWHFTNKEELFNEMAGAALALHHSFETSNLGGTWKRWLGENARSFRRALLAYRDGARLHAGTHPDKQSMEQIHGKILYLIHAGLSRHEAAMALYTLGQFTLGCVLEEQARSHRRSVSRHTKVESQLPEPQTESAETEKMPSAEDAFEFGINLLLDGLENRVAAKQRGSKVQ